MRAIEPNKLTNPSWDAEQLRAWVEALHTQTISKDDHERLQAMLIDNADAQSFYLSLLDFEHALHRMAKQSPEPLGLPSSLHRDDSIISAKPSWISAGLVRSLQFMVASAATFVIAVWSVNQWHVTRDSVTQGQSSETTEANIASSLAVKLTQSAGARLYGELIPYIGEPMTIGHQYALVEGMMELTFPSGATAIMQAPSVFEIKGPERLMVRVGDCSVHAPEGAQGFVVQTPSTQVVDLGTRFSVAVTETGETEVQVVEGAAELYRLNDSTSKLSPRLLNEQQAIRIGGDVPSPIESVRFDSSRYSHRLPDRMIGFTASQDASGRMEALQSVTVQRGGEVVSLNVDQLIPIRLIHFKAGENTHNVVVAAGHKEVDTRVLESEWLLNTGLINPGGQQQPLQSAPITDPALGSTTPGMSFLFERPILNQAGPDVLLFELQSVVDPASGDAFHVSPLDWIEGLRSHTVERFDLPMASSATKPLAMFDQFRYESPVESIADILTGPRQRRIPSIDFFAIATGIDLSWLGYDEGDEVRGLMIQDDLADSHMVDPVCIAGLPSRKEGN